MMKMVKHSLQIWDVQQKQISAHRCLMVAECIKTNSWKAIYAKTDAEYDQIVADMISQAKDYGYDECIAFQENEASLRKAAENEVKGTIK